jgi:hypothetical protein
MVAGRLCAFCNRTDQAQRARPPASNLGQRSSPGLWPRSAAASVRLEPAAIGLAAVRHRGGRPQRRAEGHHRRPRRVDRATLKATPHDRISVWPMQRRSLPNARRQRQGEAFSAGRHCWAVAVARPNYAAPRPIASTSHESTSGYSSRSGTNSCPRPTVASCTQGSPTVQRLTAGRGDGAAHPATPCVLRLRGNAGDVLDLEHLGPAPTVGATTRVPAENFRRGSSSPTTMWRSTAGTGRSSCFRDGRRAAGKSCLSAATDGVGGASFGNSSIGRSTSRRVSGRAIGLSPCLLLLLARPPRPQLPQAGFLRRGVAAARVPGTAAALRGERAAPPEWVAGLHAR